MVSVVVGCVVAIVLVALVRSLSDVLKNADIDVTWVVTVDSSKKAALVSGVSNDSENTFDADSDSVENCVDGEYEYDDEDEDEDEDDEDESDGESDEEHSSNRIELENISVPIEYAPLVLDVLKKTNIDVIDADTVHRAAVFLTPTSADANALIELFVISMPSLADKFVDGGVWSGDNSPYGVDATVGLEECDDCGDHHFDVKVIVIVPQTIVRDLTERVHRFFYPNGIEDIVDV